MRNLILTLIIWIICFTAITVGTSLTYKWYRHRGNDISIRFKDVSGLIPNQSKVMYRGVQVGSINDIDLDPETGFPILRARMTRQVMRILGKDSNFWVVRPELGLGAVSNLSAISTGDYVELHPVAGEYADDFIGLDEAPVENQFSSGLRIILKADNVAGLDVGSGLFYHDLVIGEIGEMDLAPDGQHILVTAYIDKQFVHVIRKNTIFGNISGFHADISIFGGSKITMNSLRTLVRGGIKVITPSLKAPAAKNNDKFRMLTRDQLVELEDVSC